MKNMLENNLLVHQTALNLQAYRQQLLASNIANSDTPNYKARDIVFRDALDAALNRGSQGQSMSLTKTHARHLGDKPGFSPEAFVRYRMERQSAVDGNTVDMDMERAAFAENAVHYEASLAFINGLLRSMQTAIIGQ